MLLEKITREMVQIIQKRQEHFLFQSSPDTDTDTETVHIQHVVRCTVYPVQYTMLR